MSVPAGIRIDAAAAAATHGSRFNELAYEHRTHNAVRIVATHNLARQWLAYNRIVKC